MFMKSMTHATNATIKNSCIYVEDILFICRFLKEKEGCSEAHIPNKGLDFFFAK